MSQPPQNPGNSNPGNQPPAGVPPQPPQQGQQPGQPNSGYDQPAGFGNPGTGQTPMAHNAPQGDATGGLIPYKNPPALIGYYVGILSLVPLIGNLTGIVAIILGIVGLRKRAQNPAISGVAHSWVAIVLGTLGFIGYNSCVILGIISGMLNS